LHTSLVAVFGSIASTQPPENSGSNEDREDKAEGTGEHCSSETREGDGRSIGGAELIRILSDRVSYCVHSHMRPTLPSLGLARPAGISKRGAERARPKIMRNKVTASPKDLIEKGAISGAFAGAVGRNIERHT
jgi:hypothetical protein